MFLSEKTTKYKEKVRTKSAKTAISGIFPAFSAGKEFFSKIRLGHVLSIANAHLNGKNQKKIMMKSRENAQKLVFPAYFRHFRPEFFLKIGLRHILGITILHLCAKNQEKLMSQSREKLVTNERTNEHRLIYRTSKVGPKRKLQISFTFSRFGYLCCIKN